MPKTPLGHECVTIDEKSDYGNAIMESARSDQQRDILRQLLTNGYIVSWRITYPDRGRYYAPHRTIHLFNLMNRVARKLNPYGQLKLVHDFVEVDFEDGFNIV